MPPILESKKVCAPLVRSCGPTATGAFAKSFLTGLAATGCGFGVGLGAGLDFGFGAEGGVKICALMN